MIVVVVDMLLIIAHIVILLHNYCPLSIINTVIIDLALYDITLMI